MATTCSGPSAYLVPASRVHLLQGKFSFARRTGYDGTAASFGLTSATAAPHEYLEVYRRLTECQACFHWPCLTRQTFGKTQVPALRAVIPRHEEHGS